MLSFISSKPWDVAFIGLIVLFGQGVCNTFVLQKCYKTEQANCIELLAVFTVSGTLALTVFSSQLFAGYYFSDVSGKRCVILKVKNPDGLDRGCSPVIIFPATPGHE